MKDINYKIKHQKRKRKLRSEAVVLMLLSFLLLLIISAMGISLIFNTDCLKISDVVPLSSSVDKVIVVDAGHGGYDAGGNVENIYEKDLTLAIGLYLGELLEQRGYTVVYTRKEDVSLADYEVEDLTRRVAIGESQYADAMFSLHTNITDARIDERVYGFEIYQNEVDMTSRKLAENALQALDQLNYSLNRGVKNGEIYQIVALNSVPAILVEVGFLDDQADRQYLSSEMGQRRIAGALADALDQTFSK